MGRPKKIVTDIAVEPNGGLTIHSEDLFESSLVEEVKLEQEKQAELPMNPQHEGWTSFVLGKLRNSELKDGNPTAEGLQRVAEELIGEIVESTSIVNQCPTVENGNRATVTSTVVFEKWDDSGCTRGGFLKFSGSADVYSGNTDKPYSNFPVATAETRATGRALRKALKLKSVVAAEELANTPEVVDSSLINNGQLDLLNTLCQSMNLNVQKVVDKVLLGNNINIRKVSYEQAQAIMKQISEYRRNLSGIEEEVKGFDSNWR